MEALSGHLESGKRSWSKCGVILVLGSYVDKKPQVPLGPRRGLECDYLCFAGGETALNLAVVTEHTVEINLSLVLYSLCSSSSILLSHWY